MGAEQDMKKAAMEAADRIDTLNSALDELEKKRKEEADYHRKSMDEERLNTARARSALKEAKAALESTEEGVEVTVDEAINTARTMTRHGGSFVKALGEAIFHADMENTLKIKQAFPEYWERHKRLAEREVGIAIEDASEDVEDVEDEEEYDRSGDGKGRYRAKNGFDMRDHYREM